MNKRSLDQSAWEKSLTGKKIRLRLVEEADASFVFGIRNNTKLNQYLNPITGGIEGQLAFIRSYKQREAAGEEYYFIIERMDGKPVGVVRLYRFEGDTYCWGSWIVAPGAPPSTAIESMLLIHGLAFNVLGFRKSRFDVRRNNIKAKKFYLHFGAEILESDEQDHYMVLTDIQYLTARKKFARFLE